MYTAGFLKKSILSTSINLWEKIYANDESRIYDFNSLCQFYLYLTNLD